MVGWAESPKAHSPGHNSNQQDTLNQTYCSLIFEIELAKNPSSFIYSLEFPVFIGVSESEWHFSTLHHPSSPIILIDKQLLFLDLASQNQSCNKEKTNVS
nr:hypothetical protein [Prevotella sp.]